MLWISFTILILLIANFGTGIIAKNILKIDNPGFVLTSFLGIISITLLETALAFFSPLHYIAEVFFIIFGAGGFIWYVNKEKGTHSRILFDFWFYFFVVVIVFFATFSPYLFDHYSYYVPTVSYLKEVGFVKGISNLDLLLGQTSLWHIYQAGFSHFTDPFLKVNAYLTVLFLIYIYEKKQYFLLLFLPFFMLFVQQPSPDLPVLIITLIVINELAGRRTNSVILYLSLFAVGIKPTVFWLPILVVLCGYNHYKFNIKMLIPVSIFGILVIVKNLWLFGFPVFPVSVPDFGLAWKPSQQILTYSSQIGLMKSYDMKYSYQQVTNFGILEKIYHWFTIGYKSVFNAAIILSLMLIGIVAIKKKQRFYYLLWSVLLVKSVLIVVFSAQYRFFVDVYLVAGFLLFRNLSEQKAVFSAVFFSVFFSVIFTFPGFVQQFNLGKQMSGFSTMQLYRPAGIRLVKENRKKQIGNLEFNISNNLRDKIHFPALDIYDLKLYEYYGIFPQYSGKQIRDGIRHRKLTDEEMSQLKNIISETEKVDP